MQKTKKFFDFLDVSDVRKSSSVSKRFLVATKGKEIVLSNHTGVLRMAPFEKLSVPCTVEMFMIERDPEKIVDGDGVHIPAGDIAVAMQRCSTQTFLPEDRWTVGRGHE